MKFKKFNTYDNKEIKAAVDIIKTGQLSNYIGEWGNNFYGGKKIIEMEKKYAKFFKTKHAISVNSWTSGLICAVGAIDTSPGDEIILPTWTMSACAASILYWNAIPIFADISIDDLCIDPNSIEKNITKKTTAIMAVDISGKSSKMDEILKSVDLLDFVNSDPKGVHMALNNRGEDLPFGIRKRMALARALVVSGQIVVLDEPTESIDERGKTAIYNLLDNLLEKNKTLIISSQDKKIIERAHIKIDLDKKPIPLITNIRKKVE